MRVARSQNSTQQRYQGTDDLDFSYNSLEPSVAKFLQGQALRIRQYSTKSIIQIGKDLAAAKRYVSHGQFLQWVEKEVGLPARTAQMYMRTAGWASSKSATVALLPPTALYALSSPGVPPEFVERVLRGLEAGERIQPAVLLAQIKAARGRVSSDVGRLSAACPAVTDAISNAIRILAQALTAADFELVRDIITDSAVLDNPNFPSILKSAFESVDAVLSRESPSLQMASS